jgi:hypothetical protein
MGDAETRDAVEVAFKYTEEEYTSAAVAFHTRTPEAKFSIYLGVGFFVAVLLLALLSAEPYIGGCALLGGLIVLARWFYSRSALRRHFRRNPKLRDECRAMFSDEGILFRSKDAESRLEWGFYSKVWETPDFYFLLYGNDMFSLIPKRAFHGRRHEAEFRELLRRKLDPALCRTSTPELESRESEAEYVPPPEPPDWR